jgi:hypothetical protein
LSYDCYCSWLLVWRSCVVCVCCVRACHFVLLFWIIILSYVLCIIVRILFWRAPAGLNRNGLLGGYRRANVVRSVHKKLCGCCPQHMRTVAISPLLLSSSPKWLQHHLCW